MKRWATRIVVFVLLGAIVNIAVAWGIARGIGDWQVQQWAHEGDWIAIRADRLAASQVSLHYTRLDGIAYPPASFEAVVSGWAASLFRVTDEANTARNVNRSEGVAAGFPWLSMWGGQIDLHSDSGAPFPWKHAVRARVFHNGAKDDWIMPLCPVWPGFAINTVFYAVVLWLLLAAPFALRRWRRIKRGLCPKCAYPKGTSAICTECGASVSPKAVAR